MASDTHTDLSPLEYHVLLALLGGPRHGYAIRDAVEEESGGTQAPRAGSLYRVIGRLITAGLAAETKAPADEAPHPGLPRRYYALLPAGHHALAEETQRLVEVAALARERLQARGA